jgi:hypothetical protein
MERTIGVACEALTNLRGSVREETVKAELRGGSVA